MDVSSALLHLARGGRLTLQQSRDILCEVLAGRMDDAQIGGLLALLASRPLDVDELTGAALAMREHVTRVTPPPSKLPLVDTCGTGGAAKAFNVSTLAALVAVGAAPGRVRVAKHGNRSRTGRGSAELLQALGVNIEAGVDVQERCLAQAHVCFCFAVQHHPAMQHAARARRSLGFPTIFNLLGPLTNPAGATRQLLGVSTSEAGQLVAQTLQKLGTERAVVAHGLDGLDEVTITGPTRLWHVSPQSIETTELVPEDLGVARVPFSAIQVPDLAGAVALAQEVLQGRPSPASDMVALNAAVVLVVAGVETNLPSGLAAARKAIINGQALGVLESLRRFSAP
jgi:anthranilate phosphoribosyltransferase